MSVDAPHRVDRRDPGHARLMPRDLLALRFIGVSGYATTQNIETLLGASPDIARRRLGVLRDLGLVRVFVPSLNAVNWYALAPKAREVLVEKFDLDPGLLQFPRTLGLTNLEHHEGTVHLHACLAGACARATPTIELVSLEPERQIRARLHVTGAAGVTVPDAIAAFVENGVLTATAVETDLGSESPHILRSKAMAYAEGQRAGASMGGAVAWSVAILAPSLRRLHRLASAICDADVPAGLVHLGVRADVNDRTVLTPIWMTLELDRATGDARLVPSNPFRRASFRVSNRGHVGSRNGGMS